MNNHQQESPLSNPSHGDSTKNGFPQNLGRRRFLRAVAAGVGLPIVHLDRLPSSIVPLAWSQSANSSPDVPPEKRQLTILSDRPLNAETPPHLLDDAITPNNLHFVRNNGHIPERAKNQDLSGWSLTIDGEVNQSQRLSLERLKSQFPIQNVQITLECAGNGRAGFRPAASGNQWTLGAVGCAKYTGVRLGDVLQAAGVKESAVYIAYFGEDPHLSRDPKRRPISRGVPIEKALDPHTLLVWEMNGVPLPPEHGFPLRLLCPGWPGSTSGKWLNRIWVRDRVHDGAKMTGSSYRTPTHPVQPGESVPESDMEIITTMPVKSLITTPRTGIAVDLRKTLALRGHAWSGAGNVTRVDVSVDFGSTWIPTTLTDPVNPFAWQHWSAELAFPKRGYYEVWARATDQSGRAQPMIVPGWNPKGYLNNAMHRIALEVS